jgi:hypothetical protein
MAYGSTLDSLAANELAADQLAINKAAGERNYLAQLAGERNRTRQIERQYGLGMQGLVTQRDIADLTSGRSLEGTKYGADIGLEGLRYGTDAGERIAAARNKVAADQANAEYLARVLESTEATNRAKMASGYGKAEPGSPAEILATRPPTPSPPVQAALFDMSAKAQAKTAADTSFATIVNQSFQPASWAIPSMAINRRKINARAALEKRALAGEDISGLAIDPQTGLVKVVPPPAGQSAADLQALALPGRFNVPLLSGAGTNKPDAGPATYRYVPGVGGESGGLVNIP